MKHTYSEIKNQPISWQQTIDETLLCLERIQPSLGITTDTQFIFIGCGTSFYLSQAAAALFQEVTGHISRAVPASEIFLAPSSVLSATIPTVVFAISRSGTTSEILLAIKYLQHAFTNIQVVGVTCRSTQELAKIVPNTIALDHADEKSVVMTQSFTNMLLALQVVAAKMSAQDDKLAELRQLSNILAASFEHVEDFGRELGSNLERDYYVFLGLGKYFGLANEANLKLKEMTQVACEAYNPLEFRHGPISMLNSRSCVVMLNGEQAADYLTEVAIDVTKYGTLVAQLSPESPDKNLETVENKIRIGGGLSDWSRTVLYMPALQLLAYYKATTLGLDPDQPRNLTQVVVLEGTV